MFLQRVRFDDDAYYRSFAPTLYYRGHQTELTAGVRAARFAGPLDLSARLSLSHQLNRHYQLDNDVTNLSLDVRASWRWR